MSKGLKKNEGVKSVEVSLNRGTATIDLKPGNNTTLEQFLEVVVRNGFSTEQVNLRFVGRIRQTADKIEVEVAGTKKSFHALFPIASNATQELPDGYQDMNLVVEGEIRMDEKEAGPLRIVKLQRNQ